MRYVTRWRTLGLPPGKIRRSDPLTAKRLPNLTAQANI